MMKPVSRLSAVLTMAVLAAPVAAEEKQSLDQAANDPTASLMSFQLQNLYSPNVYNFDGETNTVLFRAVVPSHWMGLDHITRLTMPYVTDSVSGKTGVSDTTIFDMAVFEQDWGRFGAGVVGLIPTGDRGLGAGQWAIGPALGFAVQKENFLWGLFNQNLFSVAERFDGQDVNLSTLQPLFNYGLGNGWSAGISEMTIVYDWDAGEFTSLPLGVKISKMTRPGGVPVQLSGTYEHNFYDEGSGPEDTVGFTVKVLLPTG